MLQKDNNKSNNIVISGHVSISRSIRSYNNHNNASLHFEMNKINNNVSIMYQGSLINRLFYKFLSILTP